MGYRWAQMDKMRSLSPGKIRRLGHGRRRIGLTIFVKRMNTGCRSMNACRSTNSPVVGKSLGLSLSNAWKVWRTFGPMRTPYRCVSRMARGHTSCRRTKGVNIRATHLNNTLKNAACFSAQSGTVDKYHRMYTDRMWCFLLIYNSFGRG